VQMMMAAEHDFPLDLLVWKPGVLEKRFREFNPIAGECVLRGKVLYDRRSALVA